MPNILDYLDWRGDLTLKQSPFNEADNLVLAQFSYIPLDGLALSTIGEAAGALKGRATLPANDRRLLAKLEKSARFGGMGLSDYASRLDIAEETQFAAVTVDLGDGTQYAAYRGTDTNIVGWKEDFNMSFTDGVPAQREAVRYLEAVAAAAAGKLRVGGHSKGGNLAMYAAIHCQEAAFGKILEVFNNDGPGLSDVAMERGGFERIKGLLRTYLPRASIVGLLMTHAEEYAVVKCVGLGVLQHDPYAWQCGPLGFVREERLDLGSQYADKMLKVWLSGMSVDERRGLTDALYKIVAASNVQTFEELAAKWYKSGPAMLAALTNIDPESRKALMRALGMLVAAGAGLREPAPQGDKPEA